MYSNQASLYVPAIKADVLVSYETVRKSGSIYECRVAFNHIRVCGEGRTERAAIEQARIRLAGALQVVRL